MKEMEDKLNAVETGLDHTAGVIEDIEQRMMKIRRSLDRAAKVLHKQADEIDQAFTRIEKQSIEITKLRNEKWKTEKQR